VRVTIKDGYAVLADGEQGHGGETIDVYDEVGARWVAQGFATEAEPEASMSRTTTKAAPKKRT